MSIEYSDGDIFESGCQALVCPVNCVGIAGAGLAKKFKEQFPQWFYDYREACNRKHVQPGQVWAYGYTSWHAMVFFSFPTKYHWKNPSLMPYVSNGLADLAEKLRTTHPVKSVAVPALGCGLGGLTWEEVKPLIEKYLGDLDCRVVVFPPKGE